MRPPPTTLSLIARRAGVSITTVSRILSGKKLHSFSRHTIERIRDVASEMKYRPNQLVRGLQTGRTGLIGVVIPAHNDFYGGILAGIHDALVAEDCVPVVLWTRHDAVGGKGKTELEQIHTLVDLRVEGIILKPIFDAASDEYLHEIFDRQLPLVVVDRELPRVRSHFVGTDDEAGIRVALEHLRALGHTQIGFFGTRSSVSTGVQRLAAFQRLAHGSPGSHLIENWSPSVEDARALLLQEPRPTAIIALNDHFAHALYRAAKEMALIIPDALSVVGFGNLAISERLAPPLTTLDQHPYEIGRTAALQLLEQISAPDVLQPHRTLLEADLIPRGSTAPVPSSDFLSFA